MKEEYIRFLKVFISEVIFSERRAISSFSDSSKRTVWVLKPLFITATLSLFPYVSRLGVGHVEPELVFVNGHGRAPGVVGDQNRSLFRKRPVQVARLWVFPNSVLYCDLAVIIASRRNIRQETEGIMTHHISHRRVPSYVWLTRRALLFQKLFLNYLLIFLIKTWQQLIDECFLFLLVVSGFHNNVRLADNMNCKNSKNSKSHRISQF